jgi:CubicO group peptidase (beta-lactamase class C family)
MKRFKPLLMLAILIFFGGIGMANAQANLDISEMQTVTNTSLTAVDLETFLDRIVPRQLETHHIPGATLAVVKDGKILVAKGYGFADLEKQIPVVANKTLFRAGSVAKLLTWTAVMQLVEQGKLDLNADINTYLKTFKIPATYPQPITMKHLLTHTAGFEDKLIGYSRKTSEDLEPLGSFVAKQIPARIFPPGKVTAYSNYGTTLAGYLIECVSNMPYERYIQKNILEPLQMTRSDFQQPPKKFANDTANGYSYGKDGFKVGAYELLQTTPAGTLNATATDMAHFMIAHLEGGLFAGKRILQASTTAKMHEQQFSNDPKVSGIAYGFYEAKVQGQRVLLHHGDLSLFRSLLAILPEKKFGLYVSYNTAGGFFARDALLDAILERYYPATKPLPQKAVLAGDLGRFAGQYLSTRAPHSTFEKIVQLLHPFYQPVRVRATDQNTLELQMPAVQSLNPQNDTPSSWRYVGAEVFQRSDGKDTLVFAQHSPMSLFLDSKAPRGYVRLGWFDTLMFQPLFPIVCGLGFLVALMLTFFAIRTMGNPVTEVQRNTYRLTLLTSTLALLLMVGLGAYLIVGFTDVLTGYISPILVGLLALGLLLAVLIVIQAVLVFVPVWTGGGLLRFGTALSALAGVALMAWLNYWNLLGFHY